MLKYKYGEKSGIRSSSVVLTDELKEAIDDAFGLNSRSSFLERAGWFVLYLMNGDEQGITNWMTWVKKNFKEAEYEKFFDGLFCALETEVRGWPTGKSDDEE
jgi:hypothetical protein